MRLGREGFIQGSESVRDPDPVASLIDAARQLFRQARRLAGDLRAEQGQETHHQDDHQQRATMTDQDRGTGV